MKRIMMSILMLILTVIALSACMADVMETKVVIKNNTDFEKYLKLRFFKLSIVGVYAVAVSFMPIWTCFVIFLFFIKCCMRNVRQSA